MDKKVEFISSLLSETRLLTQPKQLHSNEGKSHMGTNVLGLGFSMSPKDAKDLIAKNEQNADVLFPYLIGRDLYSSPSQSPSRWIINFFDWPLSKAERYADCLDIVKNNVYPERKVKKGAYSKYWWRYARRQEKLYEAIASLKRVLVKAQVSNTWAFCFVNPEMVFDQRLVVFAYDNHAVFANLQSEIHWIWAITFGASLNKICLIHLQLYFRHFHSHQIPCHQKKSRYLSRPPSPTHA